MVTDLILQLPVRLDVTLASKMFREVGGGVPRGLGKGGGDPLGPSPQTAYLSSPSSLPSPQLTPLLKTPTVPMDKVNKS